MRMIPRLFCIAACAVPGLASATGNAPGLLVPACFHPEAGGSTDWARLTAAASKVSITAIINPDSGAGSAYDPAYARAVADFKAAGGKVLGYVSTGWGKRNLLAVKSDIDKYLAWYPVDGVFFDETATGSADLDYYRTVTSYTYLKKEALALVANPGTTPHEAYMGLFDSVVMYEDPLNKLNQYSPPSYQNHYDASHFGMLVLDGSESGMQKQVTFAANNNIGYIYVNDRSVAANAWGALPAC